MIYKKKKKRWDKNWRWICFCFRSTLSKGKKEVSCWSDWQNDDRHLGGARGLGPDATTRDCRWVRIRRGKLEFETFRTFTDQSFSWYARPFLSSLYFYSLSTRGSLARSLARSRTNLPFSVPRAVVIRIIKFFARDNSDAFRQLPKDPCVIYLKL